MLTHLDLFSGIGGFSLAAEWAGFKTIGFVEKDEYCQKVLKKHWPSVPMVEDIRDVEAIKEIVTNTTSFDGEGQYARESIATRAVSQETLGGYNLGCQRGEQHRLGSGKQVRVPVTLITGGFPCQSFSVAGKRKGKEDDRYLWPEMLAVIRAIRPTWVLAENVAGIIPMALDTVLSDLVDTGYSTEALDIPACAVSAKHRRCRVWIVAWNIHGGNGDKGKKRRMGKGENSQSAGVCQDVANPSKQGLEKRREQDLLAQCQTTERSGDITTDTKYASTARQRRHSRQILRKPESTGLDIRSGESWWAVEPQLGRVAHGIPHRVDRLRCLGNAIVPQVAYEILKGIAIMELNCDG